MEANPSSTPGLKRSLSIWAAVGLSVALMAPSMAANINPQGSATYAGRAVPLTFLIAAVGVLLVAYSFVRLCQYFHHSGSVYAFVGATLGPRTGVVAGWGLLGTYTFYAVVTSAAAGIFGTAFLQAVGIWHNPPTWAPFVLLAVALLLALVLAIMPVKRGGHVLLSVEGTTVALILIVTAVVLVRLLAGNAPGGHTFTLSVFTVAPGTSSSGLFLGVVFGFLSFAGFEAAATLGEEANRPTRDIPRAILFTAIFGGLYFVIVTAVEVMGFGTDAAGVKAFTTSPSLLGDLGSTYVGNWVGDVITLGTTISAFGCCLACVVGAARLLYALSRDTAGPRGLGQSSSRWGTPVWATLAIVAMAGVIVIIETAVAAQPAAFNSFLWSGTIGTLILLVVYVLATVGCIMLVFVRHKLPVPTWQIVVPIAGLIVLGYTLYRNVIPYPTGTPKWFPVVSGAWLVAAVIAVIFAPGTARKLGAALDAREGIAAPGADDAGVGAIGSRPCGTRRRRKGGILVPELLPCVAEQSLVDHHCHGLLCREADEGTLESTLNEGAGWAGGSVFDSQAGFVFRRLCPPVLGLPPHAELDDYAARRAELGAIEVSKRFLSLAGVSVLCVDTGFTPEPLTTPAELGDLAGATAYEIVRLERVAEDVAAAGVGAAGFADAVRSALATRTASAVGVKSIAAYRTGLDLRAERPSDFEVTAAAGRWLAAATPARRGWRMRPCSGSSSGAAWTCGCRCSSTSATGTATSTCTAATRCCSRRCCGPSSPPGSR